MILGDLARNITKHLGLWACITVVLGLGLGAVWKPPLLRALVPLALFLVLYPFMFDLEPKKLKKALTRPVPLATALAVNLVVAPVLAFCLSRLFFSLHPPWLTVGFVLFGLVPCGGMVPAYTGMLNGDVNLAVTITALSLLLSVVAVPLWTEILLGTFVPVPAMLIARYLFVIIVAPFALAQLTRKILLKAKDERTFCRFKKSIKALPGPGLMLFVFVIFVLNGEAVRKDPVLILKVALPVCLFVVALLALSGLLSRLTGTSREEATALQMGSTVKNTAVAIALAFSSFSEQVALVLAISGPLAQLPTLLAYLRWKKGKG